MVLIYSTEYLLQFRIVAYVNAWINFMKIMNFLVQRVIFRVKIVKTNSLNFVPNAMSKRTEKKILQNYFQQLVLASSDILKSVKLNHASNSLVTQFVKLAQLKTPILAYLVMKIR